ncbi:PAS domain S-box-containing protein [Roseateles sp. YR242]|uniref:PAS domain S-box protein n=1 Tax=Roseateles sp. YR242 TaxID=1855305 RepID=UPI0008B60B65|nr:PAS domain S-box protein [Roseateles sp. YR242]SEL44799.1 PAS domain S-box-containing protein [Roseateles sp. YR242]
MDQSAPDPLRSLLSKRSVVWSSLLAGLWEGPWPALIFDAHGQVLLANARLVELLGPVTLKSRRLSGHQTGHHRAQELRLVDDQQQEHLLQASLHPLEDSDLTLALLQDHSTERAARERADRMQAEIDQWLDLCPLPALMHDDQGLLLRYNAAFTGLVRRLCPQPPVSLHELPPDWRALLTGPIPEPGTELQRQALVAEPQGRPCWMRVRIRRLAGPWGRPRLVLMLEDRSRDQALELAHQQLQTLMDTAGVGLATFQPDAGWSRPGESLDEAALLDGGGHMGTSGTSGNSGKGSTRNATGSPEAAQPGAAGALDVRASKPSALQGVNRDMVDPASRAEYEKLQQAIKHNQPVALRYAVRHPEMGLRWLLTRVEPGQLSSGQRTTSVLTLDVTDNQQAQARYELLLRELGAMLDGAGLGLAYFRKQRLLRSNGALGRMLGMAGEPEPGTPFEALFQALPLLHGEVVAALPGLDDQGLEFEFEWPGTASGQEPRWHALSLRRVVPPEAPEEQALVVVVSDISRLKAQQAQLEALAQDRELMFDLSDVGIAILRDDRLVRANEALGHLLGYRPDDLAALPHAELFDSPAEFEHERRVVAKVLSADGLWRGERRVRRRDGSTIWMQVSKRYVRAGQPDTGIIATYLSVDERHRAQQSLLLQTERERAVLDSVLVGIVTVGRHGIEWMNRSARRMFGGDLAAFAGQPISMVATDAPDHPFRQTHYLDELTEGQAETFECRLVARDGREFWVVGNAVVTGSGADGERQLTYALLDIERRRQAEAQSEQAQASLQRIIEAAPIAISLHDARTLQVRQINQAAAALAGREEEELIGASLEALFGSEQAAEVRNDMEFALNSSEVLQREYRLQVGGRARVWDTRLLHLSGVNDASGEVEPEQLLLVASDVTQQRAQEAARLEAAIAQRELLVREVHHRIKNNLQGVAGLLQQIAARRPEVATVINEAVGQVQAIAQVYGLQVGDSGPLRLRKVIEAVLGSVQRMFGREIQVEVGGLLAEESYRWGLPEVEAIPIALTLNELFTNALKHGGQAPVRCELVFDPEQVLLRVVNEGTLPAGFDLTQIRGGVSGLGLVRALLPRRSALLSLTQEGHRVVCELSLWPPGVSLLAPGRAS